MCNCNEGTVCNGYNIKLVIRQSCKSARLPRDMERPRNIAVAFTLCAVLSAAALLSRSRFRGVREAFLRINRFAADHRLQRDPSLIFSRLEVERKVLLPRMGGCLWDIGAHDGVYTSNSFFLIHHRQFRAWLFEPSPQNFLHLLDRYKNRPNVQLFHMAIGPDSRLAKIRTYPGGTEDTIVGTKHDQFDGAPDSTFWLQTTDAKLICEQISIAFSNGECQASYLDYTRQLEQKQFAFLSIDTEGLDMNILHRLNRTGCLKNFDYFVAESVNRRQVEDMGFRLVAREQFVAVYTRA